MARLPSGTTPFMQRPTRRADILALGKTPKRLLKVSGKHFGSQKQANIRNRTPASSTKSLSTALGGRRLRFTDVQRRRLARKAQALGRKVLNELETWSRPDTLLRWYRELVPSKWNYSHRRRPGRPRVMKTIVDLILRMALENPSWESTRIRGALAHDFLWTG